MLIILDKDLTLIETASGAKFVNDPTDQKLMAGVDRQLSRLRYEGHILAIASNQGGVEMGYKTLESATDEMRYAMELTNIDRAVFAPSYEKDGIGQLVTIDFDRAIDTYHARSISNPHTLYRKPASGMLDYLIDKHSTDSFARPGGREPDKIRSTIFIGDSIEDSQAAMNAGVTFIAAGMWRSLHTPLPLELT